ncbi:hypothetical protein ACTI_59320 [Actinoplanes sp. OR16]|uniref:hypothetical protein n=1 Tax=Actinoplanes sp. OR16 TaxID=946334 RepID=UPI000F6B5407|nr:hypothetical protein [Actinoplanes sp. OR16]BBH69247.1 hypothetical protein ACTI_59320 [Actinoplanes sp. OR16]
MGVASFLAFLRIVLHRLYGVRTSTDELPDDLHRLVRSRADDREATTLLGYPAGGVGSGR